MLRRRMIGALHIAWMGAGLAALMVGCGSSAPATPRQPLVAGPVTTVSMHWHSFDPASVTIQQGQTVQWHNTTIVPHTVTCDPKLAKKREDCMLPEGAMPFNSGDVGPDFQYPFSLPGTYRYFCIPHETVGMIGEVIVRPTTKP